MTPTSKKPAPAPCIIHINTYLCCVFAKDVCNNERVNEHIFMLSCKRVSAKDIRLSIPIWMLITRLCALSLARREAIAFLLSIYSNTYPKMPKTGSIRVEAKNSTLISTSGHDTATQLVFDSLEVKDLLEFTDHLGGEDAIRRLSVVLDYPEEDYAADLAMRGLLHYYYNVSYLVDRLKEMVAVSRAAQRRSKKTRKEKEPCTTK